MNDLIGRGFVVRQVGLLILALVQVDRGAVQVAAADLTVEITSPGVEITFVGAVQRWDADGNPRVPVDPKAAIDKPHVDAVAKPSLDPVAKRTASQRWQFVAIPPGRYDLVLFAKERVRIEGFHYPPVLEFDPFLPYSDQVPADAAEWIKKDIGQAKHYENKVVPLYLGGDDQQVRVLMQLLRDEATSFDAEFGQPVATLRHEVWQYSHRFGAWTKEKRTRVLDRVLMAKRDLRQWTWIWEPALGAIEMTQEDRTVRYSLPARFAADVHHGLLPY